MLNVEAEFKRHCGPARFIAHRREGRTVSVAYDAGNGTREISLPLRNGLTSTLRTAVHRLAYTAAYDAYQRSGQRDADIVQLLKGRTA